MSPGSGGARPIWSPCWVAVKVFMKNDSPPSAARFRPFMKPPSALVSIWRPAEWLTMAPPSALIVSPASRVAKAME